MQGAVRHDAAVALTLTQARPWGCFYEGGRGRALAQALSAGWAAAQLAWGSHLSTLPRGVVVFHGLCTKSIDGLLGMRPASVSLAQGWARHRGSCGEQPLRKGSRQSRGMDLHPAPRPRLRRVPLQPQSFTTAAGNHSL